jgi:hypothetical protein
MLSGMESNPSKAKSQHIRLMCALKKLVCHLDMAFATSNRRLSWLLLPYRMISDN